MLIFSLHIQIQKRFDSLIVELVKKRMIKKKREKLLSSFQKGQKKNLLITRILIRFFPLRKKWETRQTFSFGLFSINNTLSNSSDRYSYPSGSKTLLPHPQHHIVSE